VFEEARLPVAFEEHGETLLIAPRTVVGITEAVDDGENGAVFEDNASIGPQIPLVSVRKLALDPADGHRHRLQSRDKTHEVYVVAADVNKRIGLVRRKPILKIRAPIEIRLDHLGLAHDELAKMPEFVVTPRHQRTRIEPFMVFDPHKKPLFLANPLDFDGLLVLKDKRFHTEDVLVVLERLHDHGIMQRIGHRNDNRLIRLHLRQDRLIEIRKMADSGSLSAGYARNPWPGNAWHNSASSLRAFRGGVFRAHTEISFTPPVRWR